LPSPARLKDLVVQRDAKISVIALGVLKVFIELAEKNPMTVSLLAVVVTDGATNEVFRGVNAPLWESTGEVVSTPFRSRIAAAADVWVPTFHTYAPGSEEVATR
jgi:hypothetical protein